MRNVFVTAAFFVLFGVLLSGCGKGDINNTAGGGGATPPPTPPSTAITLSVDCSGYYCASSSNTYVGGGIGVWRAKNTHASSYASLNVDLSNVANRDITVVFTNEGNNDVSLSPIAINVSLKREIQGNEFSESFDEIVHFEKRVDVNELLKQSSHASQNQKLKSISPKVWYVGNKTTWIIEPYGIVENRTATLRKQANSNGRTINFWVEDGEFEIGKITDTMLDTIRDKFSNDIYPYAVSLAGEPWGSHAYLSDFISGDQPLDIVLVNFDKDNTPHGVVGYFYGLNNFLSVPRSNEAIVLFADTETLYLGGTDGVFGTLSTMAHELTHAINFYQRDVLHENDNFDTFLDEMSAIMMEDVLGSKIDSVYSDIDGRYSSWLANGDKAIYNCDFTIWEDGRYCSGKSIYNYSVAGSFGAFLLRQYGIDFYKRLFKTNGSSSINNYRLKSVDILDRAIKAYNSEGLGRALQRWGAGIAMFPVNVSPNGFGYPELNESGFYLRAFDGNLYASKRRLPASSPSILEAHGHFPFLRKTTSSTYKETFSVPPNVSVTIVVK
ncbi:MAG: hypothetical protein LBS39_04465 [Campylobacteraceae bacterium]|jgi:hypothetical protein|nr:hypothetical protein [Campylobacteraceae bacterium]